jgi:hypothetical protein
MDEKSERPQLVEATAKRFKAMQVAGIALICLGAATCGIFGAGNVETGTYVGNTLFWVGVALYAAGRFLAWWKHG